MPDHTYLKSVTLGTPEAPQGAMPLVSCDPSLGVCAGLRRCQEQHRAGDPGASGCIKRTDTISTVSVLFYQDRKTCLPCPV